MKWGVIPINGFFDNNTIKETYLFSNKINFTLVAKLITSSSVAPLSNESVDDLNCIPSFKP